MQSTLNMKISIVCLWILGSVTARKRPLILAHRGASGMFPEHTSIAYEMAAKQGADYIECDVTITKDLKLICSHDAWFSKYTEVNKTGKYADRFKTYNMDDDDPNFDWNDKGNIDDVFTFDFDLAELKEIKKIQVMESRDPQFNLAYSFCTFDKYLEIAKTYNVGIYPEIKQAAAINKILKSRGQDVTLQDLILQKLEENGFKSKDSKAFIQSFELSILEELKDKTDLKRIFLLKRKEKFTNEVLKRVVDNGIVGIGTAKNLIVELTDENLGPGYISSTDMELVYKVKHFGLQLHVYTFQNEWKNIPWDYGLDPYAEYEKWMEIEADALFTDFPSTLSTFLKYYFKGSNSSGTTFVPHVFHLFFIVFVQRFLFEI